MLAIDIDPFQIGDLVKYTYYDYDITKNPARAVPATRHNIGFVLDIIEDPEERQTDMFPQIVLYDMKLCQTVLTYSYNIEFISRAS